MTSSLEGEGGGEGVGQKMTIDDMMTQGRRRRRRGGEAKYPLFTELFRQAPDSKYISKVKQHRKSI